LKIVAFLFGGMEKISYLCPNQLNKSIMTQFEKALADVRAKNLQTPNVSVGGKEVDYFGYQLSVHKFNLSLMAKGMTFRGIKFSDIKKYYGLKGRSAKDCLPQFLEIMENYQKAL
jgi:hypothetical protein